jgi:hypothetical protein
MKKMKKRTLIVTIIVFLSVSMPLNSNAQNGGGHAIKIGTSGKVVNNQTSGGHAIKMAGLEPGGKPYPVRLWDSFIYWLYGK